jgi:hypothetical protein
MMDSDIRAASKGIIETLRERLAELEQENSWGSIPDTHEELVAIHEFLGRLYTMPPGYASKTLH